MYIICTCVHVHVPFHFVLADTFPPFLQVNWSNLTFATHKTQELPSAKNYDITLHHITSYYIIPVKSHWCVADRVPSVGYSLVVMN